MGQVKTELINKDLGAEASPEKVAAVIAAQVETNHTHKKLPVQMQLQEQKEPHEGGADLLVSIQLHLMWVTSMQVFTRSLINRPLVDD